MRNVDVGLIVSSLKRHVYRDERRLVAVVVSIRASKFLNNFSNRKKNDKKKVGNQLDP